MPARLRVFVSSPGDVPDERLRADLVVDKVAQDFSRFFKLETYRWEHEPMLASGHFQDAIDPPSQADIVVLILWSRLGAPLPERTGLREYRGLDGRAPVTGTEWEYEEALQAARTRGAPDILAFRNVSPAAIDSRDAVARAKSVAQLDALDAFWKRHFADRGVFLAAFDEYRSLDEFARRLEESLRKLVERRVAALAPTAEAPAPVWLGAPFRGLEPYEFEHAAIFFGRDGLVAKAAEQLAAGARAGSAFLLVSGPSGSGKSSLVKAALAPRLMKPQRIEGVAFLRRAVFRPGDGGADIFLGLVGALVRQAGPDVGLAELLAPGQDEAQLAAHLRAIVDAPGFVFAGALGRLTEEARRSGRLLAYEEAKLILVIDQIEELFTSSAIPAEDRRSFIRLIGGLARSGAVWVIATLRADFWALAAEIPELLALAERQGRLDVSPASPAELSEMIRKPAQAAGIGFEIDEESGLGLDAILAERAAAEPGALPLLSFTLDALYAKDIGVGGGRMLTVATYRSLGGLEGAIATKAEEIVGGVSEPARAALPRALRALATISNDGDQTVVARAAPLSDFPAGSPAREVVDALTAGRLLVASGDRAGATVRLAHEALIGNWRRAREQLVADRRDLQTRALIERQRMRWAAAAGRSRRQLLLRDPDLANAIDLSRRWGGELDGRTREFIAASRRRARLRQQLTAAAAIVFAVAAVAAVYGQYQARQQSARAEANFASAKQAVNHLILDVGLGLRDVQGIRVEALARILDAVKQTVADLTAANRNDSDLEASTAFLLKDFADTYQRAGDPGRARAAADEALAMFRKLVAEDPRNQNGLLQFMVSDSLNRVGDLRHAAGDRAGALKAYEESLDIRRQLETANPDNSQMRGSVSATLNLIGNLRAEEGDRAGALAAFEEGLALYRKLAAADPSNALWRTLASADLKRIGDIRDGQGQSAAALAAYQEALAIVRELAAADPANKNYQVALSTDLQQIGAARAATGDRAGAMEAYQEGLAIARQLAAADPGDVGLQLLVGDRLKAIGGLREVAGDRSGARAAFEESLAIARRFVAADPDNANAQLSLSGRLREVGNLRRADGDAAGAMAAYEESLAIDRKFAAVDPQNTEWQGALGVDLRLVGVMRLTRGDRIHALESLEESLTIVRKLATDAGNARWQAAVSLDLSFIGAIRLAAGDNSDALAAFQESVSVARKLAEAEPTAGDWGEPLTLGLDQIGAIRAAAGDRVGALAAYQEEAAIARRLAEASADDPSWRDRIATALNHAGALQAALGDSAAAQQAYEEATAIRRKLASDAPSNLPWKSALGATLHEFGNFRLDKGDQAGAIAALQEAATIRRELAAAYPGDAQRQFELSATLNQLGNALAAQAKQAEALASYEEGLAILRKLLEAHPDNRLWQRASAIRLMGIGSAKLALADRDGALAAYGEALKVSRALAAAEPANPAWRIDLALNLRKASAASDEQAAQAQLAEALAILEPLDRDGKLTPGQQQALKDVRDRLAANK